MKTWKKLLMAGGGVGAALALPRLRARSLPLPLLHPGADAPFAGLATSLDEELDQPVRVEGRLPAGLQGTLYINGPGLFERGGQRKRSLLDGDGMIVAFTFKDGGARLQARFVRTDKFREEEAAGRYLYATWTTQRPGGLWRNLGVRVHPRGQAGVTVKRWDDRLFAFDESAQPWELEPATLETRGYSTLGLQEGEALHAAHAKVDPVAREWLHFGTEYARKTCVHLTAYGPGMSLRWHRKVPVPGAPYMHDFAVSEGHVALIRHPVDVNLLKVLAGLSSFKDSMSWAPARGNQIFLFERGGSAPPVVLETESAWMWHTLNAHDRGSETVIDFVGYDHPDHLLGEEATLSTAMRGVHGRGAYPGKLRRYVIDRTRRLVRQEILDEGHHEFPFLDPRRSTRRHRYGYFAAGRAGHWRLSAVVRKDMEGGATQRFELGPDHLVLEPVFAARPGPADAEAGVREPGWLLVLAHDGKSNATRLLVLDAEHVADGPVAELPLERPLPFRFHGEWWPAG